VIAQAPETQFSMADPNPSPAGGKPPSISEVIERALKLPCSPSLLPRLMAAVDNPDNSSAEIESIISVDSALAAATLRLANSAYFGGGEPVAVLDEAIMRLGMKEVYRLAALVLIGRWESSHKQNLRWEPGDFARHSICTALAAEVLAESTGNAEPQVAYTIGLLCDLGKLALAYICPGFYPAIFEHCKRTDCTWEEAERAVLGYHNAEVGARLVRSWHFPEQFAGVIEHQLNPVQAPSDARALVTLIHAAKFMAVCLGPGVTEEGFLFAVHGDFLNEQGYTAEVLEPAMVEARNRAVSRLGNRLAMGHIDN
jgi:HD-like signal output (HDOD) protein